MTRFHEYVQVWELFRRGSGRMGILVFTYVKEFHQTCSLTGDKVTIQRAKKEKNLAVFWKISIFAETKSNGTVFNLHTVLSEGRFGIR